MSIAYALTWLMVVRGGLYSAGRRSERSVLLSRLTLLCAVRHLRVWKMNLGPNPQASLLAVLLLDYRCVHVCRMHGAQLCTPAAMARTASARHVRFALSRACDRRLHIVQVHVQRDSRLRR